MRRGVKHQIFLKGVRTLKSIMERAWDVLRSRVIERDGQRKRGGGVGDVTKQNPKSTSNLAVKISTITGAGDERVDEVMSNA